MNAFIGCKILLETWSQQSDLGPRFTAMRPSESSFFSCLIHVLFNFFFSKSDFGLRSEKC